MSRSDDSTVSGSSYWNLLVANRESRSMLAM